MAATTLLFAGCAIDTSRPPTPPAQPPLPVVLPVATPGFWYDKPAVASVDSLQFQPLWNACAAAARDDLFTIDREDYRLGLLTTRPMVSMQFFEFWRSDAGTLYGVLQSSLQTVRRTIRFEVSRSPEGAYVATPKVLVERQVVPESRLTTVAEYNGLFATPQRPPPPLSLSDSHAEQFPSRYWYPIARDYAMERELANSVREKLKAGLH